MEQVHDWFEQHDLVLNAWRIVEDDEYGNNYWAFTDSPAVQSDAELAARVHEAAHSSIAWNLVGAPDQAFYERMQELQTASQWVAETANSYGIDTFTESRPVITENEALSAAFAERRETWLEDLFRAQAAETQTEAELHNRIGNAILDEEEHLRKSLAPIYERMQELQPVIEAPESEIVPLFASMYETGLLEQEQRCRDAFYDAVEDSDEYDAETIVPALQDMILDYRQLRETRGAQRAASLIMSGNASSTADLDYVLPEAISLGDQQLSLDMLRFMTLEELYQIYEGEVTLIDDAADLSGIASDIETILSYVTDEAVAMLADHGIEPSVQSINVRYSPAVEGAAMAADALTVGRSGRLDRPYYLQIEIEHELLHHYLHEHYNIGEEEYTPAEEAITQLWHMYRYEQLEDQEFYDDLLSDPAEVDAWIGDIQGAYNEFFEDGDNFGDELATHTRHLVTGYHNTVYQTLPQNPQERMTTLIHQWAEHLA